MFFIADVDQCRQTLRMRISPLALMPESKVVATARIATVGSETIGASGDKVRHTRRVKQPPIVVVFTSTQCRYVSVARLEWFAGLRGRHRRHRGPDGVAAMPGAAEGNIARQMDRETMKRLGGPI
ncbi:hypothetical protein HDV64DRAFT_241783 [Trichoderma sp. TUCIM 5745]